MIYADTDSVKEMKAKLNSVYGQTVMPNSNYIVVHRRRFPIIIFKKYIVAIEKASDDDTAIIYTTYANFITDEEYADVIKRII